MRRDMIFCSKEGCESKHAEKKFNEGHVGWGEVVGIVNEDGENPHLCPDCMGDIKRFLDGELD